MQEENFFVVLAQARTSVLPFWAQRRILCVIPAHRRARNEQPSTL